MTILPDAKHFVDFERKYDQRMLGAWGRMLLLRRAGSFGISPLVPLKKLSLYVGSFLCLYLQRL